MMPGDHNPLYPEFSMRGTQWVYPLRDADGRPFGELNVPDAKRADVAVDVRACPYEGSRHDKPMNVSALRQITKNWDAILDHVVQIHAQYAAHVGGPQDVWWLWRLGICGAGLPGYLVKRGVPGATIPGSIGGLYKAIQGIGMTSEVVIERGLRRLDGPITTDDFVDLTEEQGVFIGLTGGACAGPPHMVHEFAHTVITGQRREPQPAAHDLGPLVGDFSKYMDYARALSNLLMMWQMVDAHCNVELRQLRDRCAAESGPAAKYAAKNATSRLRLFPDREIAALVAHRAAAIARLGSEGLSMRERHAPADAVEALASLAEAAGSPLASNATVLRSWVETFVRYVLLEREALEIFNTLQRKIEIATGEPAKPPIDLDVLGTAYARNLRTILRAPLSLTLTIASDRIIASAVGREVRI
jgi:hypothetical protein